VIRATFPSSAVAHGARALVARLRRSAQALADRQRLHELLSKVCELRAAGGCTPAQLDQAAAIFTAALLNVTRSTAA
jgi:hypothetical protein